MRKLICLIAFIVEVSAAPGQQAGYGQIAFSGVANKQTDAYTAINIGAGYSPDGFFSIGAGFDIFAFQKKYVNMVNAHADFRIWFNKLSSNASMFVSMEPGITILESGEKKVFAAANLVGGFRVKPGSNIPGVIGAFGYSNLNKTSFIKFMIGISF